MGEVQRFASGGARSPQRPALRKPDRNRRGGDTAPYLREGFSSLGDTPIAEFITGLIFTAENAQIACPAGARPFVVDVNEKKIRAKRQEYERKNESQNKEGKE
jgi:hypothetical protein